MALEDEDDKHQYQHHQQQQQPNVIQTSQSSPQSVLTLLTEIIVEILSRLPVDSLLRCRSVCKSWRSLITDPHFVKSHLSLSTRNNHYAHHRLVLSARRRTILKTCNLSDALYDSSVNALKLDCPFKTSRKSVLIVGSCNGLLCLAVEDDTLFIWNPSTRKSNRLPSYGYKMRAFSVHYGFGYEESTDDYKVVEISSNFKERFKCETFVKIYSLRNGNWKNIDSIPHGMPYDHFGKFLNGVLHWATDAAPHSVVGNVVKLSFSWTIVSLDLATETYGEVMQPVYDDVYDEGYKDLTLGSLREWLCVLRNYRGIRVDLWVMKVYGVKDSWAKLVSIPYLTDPETDQFSVPLCISNDGKILLRFGSKTIVYDSKNRSFSEIQNFDNCIQAYTFVESMVSPMPAATP